MTAPLTHDECMARLLACPALPRGERPSQRTRYAHDDVLNGRDGKSAMWTALLTSAWNDHDWESWRHLAAPLRRAREERRKAMDSVDKWRMTAATQYGMIVECKKAMAREIVGAALLAFFTDLAVLVRKMPAPCPWCGAFADRYRSSGQVECTNSDCGAIGPRTYDCVGDFNSIAIPAAYARLKDGT